MKNNKNTIIVTIKNLNDDNYNPPLELQRTLRSMGFLAEIVTPYSDLPKKFNWRITIWQLITRLSEKKGLSFLLPIIFLLKGLEIHRQIKLHWFNFDRILVYDRISNFAARKATNGQKSIILLNHFGGDPYLKFIYESGINKHRFGYILMQRILIAIFDQPIHKLLPTS